MPRNPLHIKDLVNKFFKILYNHLSFVYKDNPGLLNSLHLSISINFSITIFFLVLITLPFIQMSPMCRCLDLNVKGQACFLFWLPAIHHMGTSIFHLGHPYYMIWSCLAVTFGSVPGLLFSIFSVKSMCLSLLCPRCIHLDSFPQETWGPWVVLSEAMLRVPVMSPDPSFLML